MKHYEELVVKLELLCEKARQYSIDAELRERLGEVCRHLEDLCTEGRKLISIERPELLLALLDAYEVTRDEGMLQEVLDVVSGNMERLEVSVEAVRLLAYCYYYVEEEECAVKAREMLEELRKEGKDVVEAEKVLEEML